MDYFRRPMARTSSLEQDWEKWEQLMDRQRGQSAEVALQELPVYCDRGTKKNFKGFNETWIGSRFQAYLNDCGLPVTTGLTAASVQDRQVTIPLMKMTSSKVDFLYDVIDASHDFR